jgi:acyl-CoA synthetase (AMP-forming)/AMP-acid ligase II/alkylation response protein AidB-like acyl-CoA dehydrogenase/acyl carrier protein
VADYTEEAARAPLTRQLALHARTAPARIAYTFLREDGNAEDLTYGELERRVLALAGRLAGRAGPGARALLLYPSGLEFIVAFFACLAAGLVAVPATMADRRRASTRLRALLQDADPALVLTASDCAGAVTASLAQAGAGTRPCLCTDGDHGEPAGLRLPQVDASAIALLQYTSGSTAQPRGVEVTHGNLAANVEAIGEAFGFGPDCVMVSWLPLFHDMGLVGSVLAPLALGFRSVLMAPIQFLRQPVRWLRAISDYRATCAGAPNFGWDLCVSRVGEDQRAGLDLSSLQVAYNGSEPVRASTLRRFAHAFAPCGFRSEAQFPCYGMAEATLLVAGGPRGRAPKVRTLSKSRLESNRARDTAPGTLDAREIVSCGAPAPGVTLLVVDPDSGMPAPPQHVGEIWVSAPGVARGYRNNLDATQHTFGARLAQANCGPAPAGSTRSEPAPPGPIHPGPYLRTGDLGFLRDGELYITGRLRDLLIVNGRNLYPQDVEEVAERIFGCSSTNMCAAFALEGSGRERLAVVIEADRALVRAVQGGQGTARAAALTQEVRSAITQQFGVAVATVALVHPGSFPRTTSGKVQRARCKALAESGALSVVYLRGEALGPPAPAMQAPVPNSRARAEAMTSWLRRYAARRLNSRLIDERRTVPPYVVLDLGNEGFFGLPVPQAYGGQALSNVDLMRVLQQLAAIDLTLATAVGVHNGLGLRPLLQFGPEALQRQLLPRLASGRQLAAYAQAEPHAGSNPQAMRARARRVDGGWRLCADKHLIGLASWSGLMTVLAKAVDRDGSALGPIALLVAEDSAGLVHGPEALTMGMRGMVQNALRCEDVFVPDSHVLLAPGEGMQVADDALGFARLIIGALSVGAMKRCAQLMARYAARREVATGRLLDNPVSIVRLHELTCAVWAMEALVDAVATALDARCPLPQHACLACKCVGAELLWETADRLVQMLGGRGYLENNGAPQMLRDARVLRILEGPTETLYMQLGGAAAPNCGAERILADALALPSLAAELGAAVAAIRARAADARLFAGESAAMQWLDFRIGELCAYALLLGAAERRAQDGQGGAQASAALEWARARFDGVRNAIAAEQDAARAAPSPAVLLERIAAFSEAVGDVDQQLAGEDQEMDSLLRVPDEQGEAAPWPGEPTLPRAGTLPRPAPPAMRQLVRDSVGRWLATEGRRGLAAFADDTPFAELGIDSLAAVPIALDIEHRAGLAVVPELLFDYPTVNALADYLHGRRRAG